MKDKKDLILIIDNVELNMVLLSDMIEDIGYQVATATGSGQAVDRILETGPQLVIMNIAMPDIDGYEFCTIMKENPRTRSIPVILLAGLNVNEDRNRAFEAGCADIIGKPFDRSEIQTKIALQLKIYHLEQELAEGKQRLNVVIHEQASRIDEEKRRLLKTIARISEESKDFSKGLNHLENVAFNARVFSQALNFSEEYENKISPTFIEGIELAGAVHDIGKISIPKDILNKPSALTEEESQIVRNHTLYGYDILEAAYPDVNDKGLIQIAANVLRSHHENWDGSGYPDGLKGKAIPLEARILRIVDSFDVLVNERTYKPAYPKEEALEMMKKESGRSYDPYLLDVFLKIEKQMKY